MDEIKKKSIKKTNRQKQITIKRMKINFKIKIKQNKMLNDEIDKKFN
jgi:hypothetical protein